MDERHRRLLVRQNPWWQDRKPELPKFKRDLLEEMLKHLDHKQIVAIVGLRRVGKTTMMKQIIQNLKAQKNNICYISFDDIDFQKYETADDLINYFLEFSDKKKRRYLFLDEVQKLPNWADLLKTYYDTENNLKMLVSGSASLEIKKHKETLAGRILSFHLPIFTFKEFARYFGMEYKIQGKNLLREYDLKFSAKKEQYKYLFEKYLASGAFPELIETDDDEFIRKYVGESVVEKAISDVARITGEDEKTIYELFRLLAHSNAQLFDIVNLARVLGTNRNKVSRYVSLLEKSFLIKIGYNYTASVAIQVRKSKKQYVCHSSVVMALLGYRPEILNTEVAGHLVEATIANNLEKISFWRTPQKDEVDIVAEQNGLMPIEVKYRGQISRKDVKSLLKFMKKFNIEKGTVITKELLEKKSFKEKRVLFIPAWLFLLLV